jgi:hypothetical protein
MGDSTDLVLQLPQTMSRVGTRFVSPARLAVATALAALATLIGLMASPDAARPVATAATTESGFYGVAPTTALTAGDFQRLAAANIRTVRVIFYWPSASTGDGTYNWLNVDGAVIHASAAGIRLIPTLLGSPRHVSGEPLQPPLGSPEDEERWQDFVRSAVERYGPGGEFWDFLDNARRTPGTADPMCRTLRSACGRPGTSRTWIGSGARRPRSASTPGSWS